MNTEKKDNFTEIEKEIVIERLRQTPPTVRIAFGELSKGKFMNRDELIKNIEEDTDLGRRIIKIQLNYLRAFKKGISIEKNY